VHIRRQARSNEQSAGVTKRGAPNAFDSVILLRRVSCRWSVPTLAGRQEIKEVHRHECRSLIGNYFVRLERMR
jgi:hypothetical protein